MSINVQAIIDAADKLEQLSAWMLPNRPAEFQRQRWREDQHARNLGPESYGQPLPASDREKSIFVFEAVTELSAQIKALAEHVQHLADENDALRSELRQTA